MPKIFNLGSINIDHTIKVSHFARPGETIHGQVLADALGGKGMNISIALERAGQDVIHIGAINGDDRKLVDLIRQFEIDQSSLELSNLPSGQAYIFLDANAENSIVVCAGANLAISETHITNVMSNGSHGDWLVMQNETNGQQHAAKIASEKGMQVALVAAPFNSEKVEELLDYLDLLIVNETEAAELEQAINRPVTQSGVPMVLVTKGSKGASLTHNGQGYEVAGEKVVAVDTTGAGDAFFGFFLASWISGKGEQLSLEIANKVASIVVQRVGAANSIPKQSEI